MIVPVVFQWQHLNCYSCPLAEYEYFKVGGQLYGVPHDILRVLRVNNQHNKSQNHAIVQTKD
jgi:hypothetical protein